MNKTTKAIAKWTAGVVVTALLFWHLYRQIQSQAATGAAFRWWPRETTGYFIATALLLPVNIALEGVKWQRLLASALRISWTQSVRSVLAGITASLITPNRIGDYPGRILVLREPRNTRLISISVLGVFAQIIAVMIGGVAGLTYYAIVHPEWVHGLVLLAAVAGTAVLLLLYFSFERWAPKIEGIQWLRKLRLWGRLLHRFSAREQGVILALSLLRFAVYTFQYWLLLRWQGIPLPLAEGFLLCALFFWVLAVIPSIALAELGIRGTVSLALFKAFSTNFAGIAAATFVLWCLNLMLPALAGIAFFFRRGRR